MSAAVCLRRRGTLGGVPAVGFFLPVRVLYPDCSAAASSKELAKLHHSGQLSASLATRPASHRCRARCPLAGATAKCDDWSMRKRPFPARGRARHLSSPTHRVAISTRRLVTMDEMGTCPSAGRTIETKGRTRHKDRTLSADEFAPLPAAACACPTGFHRIIRHYGAPLANVGRRGESSQGGHLLNTSHLSRS